MNQIIIILRRKLINLKISNIIFKNDDVNTSIKLVGDEDLFLY